MMQFVTQHTQMKKKIVIFVERVRYHLPALLIQRNINTNIIKFLGNPMIVFKLNTHSQQTPIYNFFFSLISFLFFWFRFWYFFLLLFLLCNLICKHTHMHLIHCNPNMMLIWWTDEYSVESNYIEWWDLAPTKTINKVSKHTLLMLKHSIAG